MNTTNNKITADHLARHAYVYIRQSTPDQVKYNLESKRLQYGLVDRARTLGWQDVEVIDEDLGISGEGTPRSGFERLLRAVCEGQVGAVLSIEASRLARNGREWHTLLEFCGIVGVLLIDAQAIYDPRLTNDRLLLGVKGTISEMEVATFRERAQSAVMQMAQRGALVRRVAIGYVKGADGRIEKDPDARVRAAIDLIFRKFAELGSVRQVYFWLDQQHIQLPIVRGREGAQEIIWQAARYHAMHSVLKNPIYAGAYAYGRSQTVRRLEAGQKRVVRQLRRRREQWSVLILNHHEGYIDWDIYENNQKVITDNENARGGVVRGAIKKGDALLAGLLRCGHCGAKLLAQHPRPGVIRYQCSGYILNRDQECCVMFGGLRADRLVSEQLLQCLAPLGLEAAVEAIAALQGASDDRVQQKRLALERARYEVAHARRQYDAVDPSNRLVAAELERRWNQALTTEAQLEGELTSLQQTRERPLSDAQKQELLEFARDLPRLWDAPRSSPEYKKRLLRIALKEIIVTCEGETIRLVLHWQGGDHTRLEVVKNRTGQNRWKTDVETVQLVRELARMLPDHSIAPVLNRLGIRSAKGYSWTQLRVRNFRSVHQIAVYRGGERAERHELILYEAASRLGVSKMTVVRLIRDGLLPARQACVGAPYVIREDDLDRPAVRRALANGRAVSPDPRQERLSFQ